MLRQADILRLSWTQFDGKAATELGQTGAIDEQTRAQTGHKPRNIVAVCAVPERELSKGGQRKRTAWKKRGENDESKS